MTDVLVCVKRVPDSSGEVRPHRRRPGRRRPVAGLHDEPARGVRRRARHPDRRRRPAAQATVLTLGDADAVEQLRTALARRLHRRDPRRGRRRRRSARPTSPARSPRWSATTRRRARRTTWSCSATTPPTPATSRSASGSPTSSAGRWSTASRRRRGRRRTAWSSRAATGPDGPRDLRGAAAGRGDRAGGRRRAALPDGAGPDEGQEGRRSRSARRPPSRPARAGCGCSCRRRRPATSQILGEGPEAAPAVVDLFEKLGVLAR